MPPRRDPDPWLDREEQAALLGVSVHTIAQYVTRYGPDHPNPYPTNVVDPNTTKRFGRTIAIRASALNRWNARRPGSQGRPRVRPEGLSPAQHRGLAAIARGRQPLSPRVTLRLIELGHAEYSAGGLHLTPTGRTALTNYPIRQD